jgi:tetratricopeptide (TPR) repeat protein
MNLGIDLGRVGQLDQALQMTQKAEQIFKELIEKEPSAYMTAWADAVSNFGVYLKDSGRIEEALRKMEIVEEVYRSVADKQPDAHEMSWTISLANLAHLQCLAGQSELSLATATRAVSQASPFAKNYPSEFKHWLAFSYQIVADSCFNMSRVGEALEAARKSTEAWIDVASIRPDFPADIAAKAFLIRLRCEAAGGDEQSINAVLNQSVEILRVPLRKTPIILEKAVAELIQFIRTADGIPIDTIVPNEFLAIESFSPKNDLP